jgi:hypothetical protein
MTTGSSGFQRPVIEPEPPTIDTLEGRASLVFKVLAITNLGGVVLALFPGTVPVSTLLVAMFNIAALSLAVLFFLTSRGLDHWRPWAVAAVRPLLATAAAYGLVVMAIGFGEGKLRVPFETVLAGWAWLGAQSIKPRPKLAPRSLTFIALSAALVALIALGKPLFSWGGTFDVHEPDLTAAATADCGPPGGGPPATIKVTYAWSWRGSSVLPSGSDIVVIGWTGSDDQLHPLYILGDTPVSGIGVYPGQLGFPSTDMADQVGAESDASFRWAVDLREQGFRPGHLEVVLRRATDNPPNPQPLQIAATYVHLGIWRHPAATVTCSW